jgi:hypothetical protein
MHRRRFKMPLMVRLVPFLYNVDNPG